MTGDATKLSAEAKNKVEDVIKDITSKDPVREVAVNKTKDEATAACRWFYGAGYGYGGYAYRGYGYGGYSVAPYVGGYAVPMAGYRGYGPMVSPMAAVRRRGDRALVVGRRQGTGGHRRMLGGVTLFVKAHPVSGRRPRRNR